MKKTGKYLLLVFLILLILAGILTAVFWNAISVYLFPKMVLTDAVSHTVAQLQQRFEGDPALMLVRYLDEEGHQSIHMDADVSDPLLDNIHYDMQIQTEPHRFLAQGIVQTGQRNVDLSVFMDPDFMAVSSDNLVNGSYYGITYRSFSQDIRSIPLLGWMIGESVLQKWNDSVMSIQSRMEKGYNVPRIPNINEEDFQKLLLVLVAAPSDVQKTTIILQHKPVECHRIAYSVSGTEVLNFLKTYLKIGENASSAAVDAAFYLCDNTLILADLTIQTDKTYHVELEFGKQCLTDPLTAIVSEEASDRNIRILVKTERKENGKLHEYWDISGWGERGTVLSYDWDPNTQQMLASIDEGPGILMHVSETEAGLRIETRNLSELFRSVLHSDAKTPARSAKGVLVLNRGTQFETPEYKNLDKWSMDDFWALLEGVGGLIGISYQ